MSNSARAKKRRSKRSKLTKQQRDIMTRQHWGDYTGNRRQEKAKKDSEWARFLNLPGASGLKGVFDFDK